MANGFNNDDFNCDGIITGNVTVGIGKALDVSAGTLTLDDDQISGDAIDGGTIGSTTITTLGVSTLVAAVSITCSTLNVAGGIVQTDGAGVFSTSTDLPTATTIGAKYVYRVDGTDVAIVDGGTNSSAALANGKAMVSVGGAIVEGTVTVVGGAVGAVTTLSMTGELDMTGTGALIDLNPAGTGSATIINITPTASLAAGSSWFGTNINLIALDPATGAACTIYGHSINAQDISSVDYDATIYPFNVFASPTEDTFCFTHRFKEMTQDNTQTILYSKDAAVPLSATATYTGIDFDWSSLTRDAGAPVLRGLKIELPGDYTGFGTCYAATFTGDGKSVTICDTTNAITATGTVSATTLTDGTATLTGGAWTGITTLTTSDDIIVGAVPFRINPFSAVQAILTFESATSSWINVSPQCADGSSVAEFSLFRGTDTDGVRQFKFYAGNGTGTSNGSIVVTDTTSTATFSSFTDGTARLTGGAWTGITTINMTGLLTTTVGITVNDTRAVNTPPTGYDKLVTWDFKTKASMTGGAGPSAPAQAGTFGGMFTLAPWSDASGGNCYQMYFLDGGIAYRYAPAADADWTGVEWATIPDTSHSFTMASGTTIAAQAVTAISVDVADGNITNVGDIALDSITADNQDVTINMGASGNFIVDNCEKGRMTFNDLKVTLTMISFDDETTYNVETGTTGWGKFIAGDHDAWASFRWDADGTMHTIQSGGSYSTLGSDNFFTVWAVGAGIQFYNRLGSAKNVMLDLKYFTA